MYVELNRRQQRDKLDHKDKWPFKKNSAGMIYSCPPVL